MISIPQSKIEKAAGKGKDKPVLTGVYYDAKHKRMVAADGHIMAIVPVEADDETQSCIIPASAVKDARKMGAINYKETGLHYPSKHGAVTVQPIEGNFPDYTQIIPAETAPGKPGTITIALDAKKLLRLAEAICEDSKYLFVALTVRETHKAYTVRPVKGFNHAGHFVDNGAMGVIMPIHMAPIEPEEPELLQEPEEA